MSSRSVLQFSSHGDTPAESSTGTRSRVALLPELHPRSNRPADLRRLFCRHLPALRHAAGISRRTRNRIMDPSLAPAAEPPPSNAQSTPAQPTLIRGLSLLDSVLLLVSGIIGSSIFLTAKDIAGPLPQPMLFLLVWVIGGVVSLFGCVAFAELGSMFPESGGQYVYLREAYGDLVAFLYGWMLFAVANGGTIAALSVASAAYTGQVFPIVSQEH